MSLALRRVYAGKDTNLATLVTLMDEECFCSVVENLSGEDHLSADAVLAHHPFNVCHRCLLYRAPNKKRYPVDGREPP